MHVQSMSSLCLKFVTFIFGWCHDYHDCVASTTAKLLENLDCDKNFVWNFSTFTQVKKTDLTHHMHSATQQTTQLDQIHVICNCNWHVLDESTVWFSLECMASTLSLWCKPWTSENFEPQKIDNSEHHKCNLCEQNRSTGSKGKTDNVQFVPHSKYWFFW